MIKRQIKFLTNDSLNQEVEHDPSLLAKGIRSTPHPINSKQISLRKIGDKLCNWLQLRVADSFRRSDKDF